MADDRVAEVVAREFSLWRRAVGCGSGLAVEDGFAVALVAALRSAGYAVVPVEPTHEQGIRGMEADDRRTGVETCCHIYRAMLAAHGEGLV